MIKSVGNLSPVGVKNRIPVPQKMEACDENIHFTVVDNFPLDIVSRLDLARNNKIRQLTAFPFIADAPTWSPDGTQIAFFGWSAGGLRGIYVVSAEGGKPELLIPDGNLPAWCCPSMRFAVTPREKLTTNWGQIKKGY